MSSPAERGALLVEAVRNDRRRTLMKPSCARTSPRRPPPRRVAAPNVPSIFSGIRPGAPDHRRRCFKPVGGHRHRADSCLPADKRAVLQPAQRCR